MSKNFYVFPTDKVFRNEAGQISRPESEGPAVIRENGDQFWFLDGELHRLGGPAAEMTSIGKFSWYFHGERKNPSNNADKPIVEYANGRAVSREDVESIEMEMSIKQMILGTILFPFMMVGFFVQVILAKNIGGKKKMKLIFLEMPYMLLLQFVNVFFLFQTIFKHYLSKISKALRKSK
jgi:hypothetical protein